MIRPGDRVRHKIFPPVEGTVMGAQPILNSEPKISVMRDNGSLFWDVYSTWELIDIPDQNQKDIQEVEVDYVDAEFTEID